MQLLLLLIGVLEFGQGVELAVVDAVQGGGWAVEDGPCGGDESDDDRLFLIHNLLFIDKILTLY